MKPCLFLFLSTLPVLAAEWTSLLDQNLSRWEIYGGVPHPSVEIAGHPKANSEKDGDGVPLGLGKDPLGVFKMIEQDGQPVLHISGQIYAGLSTKEEFENYHLTWQFKWGEKKWPPRVDQKRDSGMLLHCQLPHGAFWNVWMRSLECQIQEGDCGDFVSLAGTFANIPLQQKSAGDMPIYHREGKLYHFDGYAKHGANHEKPNGEWNTLEVLTVGDTMVFKVNGVANMVLFDTRERGDGDESLKPLVKGRIQLQSEAAEIFYKDIRITPIQSFPEDLREITTRPSGEAIPFKNKE